MFHSQEIHEEWREEKVAPFNELILTWNGLRPSEGDYRIYVSVKTDEWSPYLLYALWGKDKQSSFFEEASSGSVRVYQDAVEVLNGHTASGFQVKIESENGEALKHLTALHVYTNGSSRELKKISSFETSYFLDVRGLSQRILPHPRCMDLCSPTSTTAVIRFLSKGEAVDPVLFAENSRDRGFDIYGNWVLNVAESSHLLGSSWNCWVQRLDGFTDIYERLKENTPVVVSVRGPLPGSALPYAKGHLLVVRGFDAANQKVLCMDPAFLTNEETYVSYPLKDFEEAWKRRGYVAYIFTLTKRFAKYLDMQ